MPYWFGKSHSDSIQSHCVSLSFKVMEIFYSRMAELEIYLIVIILSIFEGIKIARVCGRSWGDIKSTSESPPHPIPGLLSLWCILTRNIHTCIWLPSTFWVKNIVPFSRTCLFLSNIWTLFHSLSCNLMSLLFTELLFSSYLRFGSAFARVYPVASDAATCLHSLDFLAFLVFALTYVWDKLLTGKQPGQRARALKMWTEIEHIFTPANSQQECLFPMSSNSRNSITSWFSMLGWLKKLCPHFVQIGRLDTGRSSCHIHVPAILPLTFFFKQTQFFF